MYRTERESGSGVYPTPLLPARSRGSRGAKLGAGRVQMRANGRRASRSARGLGPRPLRATARRRPRALLANPRGSSGSRTSEACPVSAPLPLPGSRSVAPAVERALAQAAAGWALRRRLPQLPRGLVLASFCCCSRRCWRFCFFWFLRLPLGDPQNMPQRCCTAAQTTPRRAKGWLRRPRSPPIQEPPTPGEPARLDAASPSP